MHIGPDRHSMWSGSWQGLRRIPTPLCAINYQGSETGALAGCDPMPPSGSCTGMAVSRRKADLQRAKSVTAIRPCNLQQNSIGRPTISEQYSQWKRSTSGPRPIQAGARTRKGAILTRCGYSLAGTWRQPIDNFRPQLMLGPVTGH